MKEDDDNNTVLPPFPTHLVSAIVEKEKEEKERLGREFLSLTPIKAQLRAMINQDKSLHLFKDIEEEELDKIIVMVIHREGEVICNKCSNICFSDDTKCLFCDCLGNYCGNCSPGDVCPNYPDCKCGCEVCIPESDEEPDES